jgi:hypothetical protein
MALYLVYVIERRQFMADELARFTIELTEDKAEILAKYFDKHGFEYGEEELIGQLRALLPRTTPDESRSSSTDKS